MERCICNQCFASMHRGKKPFCLTDCGHVYCQRCIEQARDQCPQCKSIGVRSLVLEKPLLPQIAHFFSPTSDVLIKLQRTHAFQAQQTNILVHRFMEIDAKYEVLKTRYQKAMQDSKRYDEMNKKLKLENEKLAKKLMSMKLCSGRSTSTNLTTPGTVNSTRNWFMPNRCNETSQNIGDFITPTQNFSAHKDHTSTDYCMPRHKLARPSDFYKGFDSNNSVIPRR